MDYPSRAEFVLWRWPLKPPPPFDNVIDLQKDRFVRSFSNVVWVVLMIDVLVLRPMFKIGIAATG
jgi:hypothetical protein